MFRWLLAALAMVAGCAATPAQAEWNRADTAHFTIRAELGQAELRKLAGELESIDALLRAVTGVTARPGRHKADIVMFDQADTIAKLASLPKFSGGMTLLRDADPLVLVASQNPQYRYLYDVRRTLFHEYAHAFMRHYLPSTHPGWYIEGFATFFESSVVLPNGTVRYGGFPLAIAPVFDAERHVNFEDVMAISTNAKQGPAPDRVYAFGWVLAHHYLSHAGRSVEIGHYLDAVAAGRSVANADIFFAGGIAALDRDMSSYVKALPPPHELALPPIDPAGIAVRAMRPGETALLQRRVIDSGLDEGIDGKRSAYQQLIARGSYQAVRNLLDTYPDENELAYYTARLALGAGEARAADALADRLLAADPANPDLLALKARALTAAAPHETPAAFQAAIASGRATIARAQAIEPDNAAAAVALYHSYLTEQGPTAVTRHYLDRAIQVDPGNGQLRLLAVDLAYRANDYRGVIALLEPVANSPHDTPARTAALNLVAEMRQRLAAPASAVRKPLATHAGTAPRPAPVITMPPVLVAPRSSIPIIEPPPDSPSMPVVAPPPAAAPDSGAPKARDKPPVPAAAAG